MNVTAKMLIKTMVMDAVTGLPVKENDYVSNLFLDQGLNGLAKKAGGGLPTPGAPANAFNYCHTGSGINATKISSGAITFTQATTTLTASAGFFTSAMVNGLFKWGVGAGGNELYITAFTDSTHVTVGTSATV